MTDQTTFAFAYARVSTDDHDQNPESQLVEIRKWAKTRNIEIVEEFADKATGTNAARPELQRIFGAKIMRPEVSKLIVLDADRLSRNMDDAPTLIKEFNRIGLQIVYVADENLDLTTKEGKLMNAMKSYGAQSYTDSHKLKIMAGLDRARAEGKHIGRPLKRADAIDLNLVIRFAQEGYSLRRMEKVFKCSRNTLVRRVRDAGRYEELSEILESHKSKKSANADN